ncbi:MAG: helix-turn-helix domain-containing protein [Moorella sp. (in: firmicutes)]
MTLQELEQAPTPTLTVKEAAEIMKVTPRFLQLALQQGRFPFGTAVKMKRWSYYINTERFIQYMKGRG